MSLISNKCCICMEEPFLPVEFICFPCYSNKKIHCCSFYRICMLCANNYLELDKDIGERDFYKKCIFCPSLCCLHSHNRSNSYKIDFCKIVQDEANHYICPYCNIFTGSQIQIFHHLEKDCECYYIENVNAKRSLFSSLFLLLLQKM